MTKGRPLPAAFLLDFRCGSMLRCGIAIAAMQTQTLFWHLVYRILQDTNKEEPMPTTISAVLDASSSSLLSRLFATLDRLLLAYAEMSIRNGDIPRYL
jgi:hypothetical protein